MSFYGGDQLIMGSNACRYLRSLEAAGFTQEQAKVISQGVLDVQLTEHFASKEELYEVRDQLNKKIDEKFSFLDQKIDDKFSLINLRIDCLSERLDHLMDNLFHKLFSRFAGLMIACVSLTLAGTGLIVGFIK